MRILTTSGDATADDVILAAVPDATRVHGRARR
jgi:hypothetical protein